MEHLFEDIITTFEANKSKFTDAGLKPPFIDLYQGQVEHPEYFEFNLPALFMDYAITPQKEGKLWVNNTSLIFYACPELAPSASNKSSRRPQGLKPLIWYGIIKDILDTVSGRHYTTLMRGPEKPGYGGAFNYHTIDYSTVMDQLSGKEKGRYTDGTIEQVNTTGQIKSRFSL